MASIEAFLLKPEMTCLIGFILGVLIVIAVGVIIYFARNDRARSEGEQSQEMFLKLFHELRKSKTEEMNQVRQMTLEILREIKKEIK